MKDVLASKIANFTWSFGPDFFLETDVGNFIWSDPDYNGSNTIRKFDGNYKEWSRKMRIPYGRDKGKHHISKYCGTEWTYSDQ